MNHAVRNAMAETGETAESLAAQIGVSPKTAARWVAPGRVPQSRHRAQVASLLKCEVADLWPNILKRPEPVWFRPWTDIEREAVALRWFEPAVIPGLLQTEAYAREVLSGAGIHEPDDVERILTSRMARQDILVRDHPPKLTVVLDEGVLRRPIGGPAVMREQLETLVAACGKPHIRVQVVPATVGSYAGLNGPFVVATNADRHSAAFMDNQVRGQVVSDADEVAAILAAWDAIRGEALSHWQSVDLIKEVAKTWT